MSRVEDQRNTEVYAIVPMQFGQVNLYPAMDHLMETVAEGTENNMIAYQGARIKHLLGLIAKYEAALNAAHDLATHPFLYSEANLRDASLGARLEQFIIASDKIDALRGAGGKQ